VETGGLYAAGARNGVGRVRAETIHEEYIVEVQDHRARRPAAVRIL
jgi:hypothetical protein